MAARNEELEAVLKELELNGLKGVVSNRAKHIEVAWTYPNGVSRFHIVSASGSDRRGWLNARGDVRRRLRQDEAMLPKKEVVRIQRAFELLASAPTLSSVERTAQLEQDFASLLDCHIDLQHEFTTIARELAELKTKLSNLRVTAVVSFAEELKVEAPAPVQAQAVAASEEGPSAKIMALLSDFKWHSKAEMRKLGIPEGSLGSTLYYLKTEKQLIINGQPGLWRKLPIEAPFSEVASG